ncbi:MAG: pyridoxamine 5'-phosphate oxidase family protein [Chloroflexota bacterium]|nr:pyridoxamine 5'-phosphate oxidase family protein [Chloroflexota bacterium]MDE2948513.1 pyridoxamine 5'-phosphate oxidase family protein [Chloroflexota bacterium]
MIQPKNARRVRPNMPNYGVMPDATDAMLSWDWVERQMHEARNYWICSVCADGRPHSVPVWGAWVDGVLYFGTDRQSVKARNIARDNRVVVHLDSGEETVIIEGDIVEAQIPETLLKRISERYIEKYALDPKLDDSGDLLLQLAPAKVMAWRERDYPATATCWLFDVCALN